MPAVDLVVVSAAGLGSRLGLNLPKCLVDLGGSRVIDHQLDLVEDIPEIRVVVGFREDEVVRHVSRRRPDAIFVRNSAYATTTTIHSIRLATRNIRRPFLILDGDLLIEPESFDRFLSSCAYGDPLIGVASAGADDAVYVTTRPGSDRVTVTGFQRAPRTDFEWTGVAFVRAEHVAHGDGHVFESLAQHLPLRATEIVCREIDTPADLERAREVLAHGWPPRARADAEPSAAERSGTRVGIATTPTPRPVPAGTVAV